MRRPLLSVVLLTLLPLVAQAQSEPTPTDVDKLIQELGDNDFQTREQALEELVNLGESVRAAVQKATASEDPEIATRAKLVLRRLATKDVEDAQVHVVGLYESRDGPAIVKVDAVDEPIILVVCAYESVTWEVQPAEGARIVQVIASGYHQQFVQGVKAQVITLSYDERSPGYFYTYDHDERRFPKMLAGVKELTGKAPSSFQGRYSFKSQAFRVPFQIQEE